MTITAGPYTATLTDAGFGYTSIEITEGSYPIGDAMAMPADRAEAFAREHVAALAAR